MEQLAAQVRENEDTATTVVEADIEPGKVNTENSVKNTPPTDDWKDWLVYDSQTNNYQVRDNYGFVGSNDRFRLKDSDIAVLHNRHLLVDSYDIESYSYAMVHGTPVVQVPSTSPEVEEVQGDLFPEQDIMLVASQANVSRRRAVSALLKHKGDLVNSIFELTM